MPCIVIGEEHSSTNQIYNKNRGTGQPVMRIDGRLLNGRSCVEQMPAQLDAGYCDITCNRREFGHPSQATFGYDSDSLAVPRNFPPRGAIK
jgi:hypothetical protein